MANTTIGSLRVVLGLDSAQFTEGLSAAQKHLQKVGKSFEKVGSQFSDIGKTLSLSLTAPLVAMGAGALKASADFETAMKRVSISTKASAKDMAAMEVQARKIGKETVFSAGEAADAMDMLAKNGLDTQTILGGAAKAAVDLAAAAGSELEPAAAAVSDSLKQFHLEAADLPAIVNQITGAVNESKLGFSDYTGAIAQAGGVAAGLGVSFADFNAALAGTSALFASGSDAGTSFKTFLTTLVPKSKDAAALMKQFGLTFYEANGSMKNMSDIAEMLKVKLGGLSDEAKTNVLKEIFGTDAMRTAIGLMDLGAEGLAKVKAGIAETDAAAQSAQRMTGLAGQMDQLKGALDNLGISIGKSGLLQFATELATSLSAIVDRMAEADPAFLRIAVVAGAVVAAIGPLLIVAGAAVSAIGTLIGVLAAPVALPIIAGIGAAVAGLAVVFALFGDEIIPAVKAFGASLAENVGPKIQPLFEALGGLVTSLGGVFDTYFGGDGELGAKLAAFGEIVSRVLGAALSLFTGFVNALSSAVDAIGALIRGDFSGMWRHLGEVVTNVLGGIGGAFSTMVPEVIAWVKQLYTGVKTWLVDKLTGAMSAVSAKTKEVGDAFFELYDRVVGHSYVPDMVEGVASWMAKLDAGMVKPAKDATKKSAAAFKDLRDDVERIMDGLLTDNQRKIRALKKDLLTLREGYDKKLMTEAQYVALVSARQREEIVAAPPPKSVEGLASGFKEAEAEFDDYLENQEKAWDDSLKSMGTSFRGFFQGWIANGKADWKRLLLDLTSDWQNVLRGLGQMTSGLGATLSKVIGTAGSAMAGLGIGKSLGLGTGSGGLDLGLSLAGSIAGTAFAGTAMATTIASGIGSALTPVLGTAMATGLTGALASAAVLGPIAAIAVLAAGSLFKKKPSNNGALATFDGDNVSLSGDKRTEETASMATQAAQAILTGQKMLEAAGATLTATVKSIDIGTRDATDIIMSNGQALTSAVGDAAAAAETGLKAMLAGATFANEAQTSLVQSMLAAGKGFDDIIATLGNFADAQAIPKAIADAILQLKDPKAYDTSQLDKTQAARRAEIEAQFKAGFLTAEQFAAVTDQLKILEGLELDQVMGKFANQTDKAGAAMANVDAARAQVEAAWRAARAPIETVIDRFKTLGEKLREASRALTAAALATTDPQVQLGAAKGELDRVRALAKLGDADAMERLQGVGEDYLKVLEAFAPDALTYLRGINYVQEALNEAADTAERTVSVNQRQLEALDAMVKGQIPIVENTKGLVPALDNLAKALANLGSTTGRSMGANPSANAALAAATGYTGNFGDGSWHAWILQQDEATKAKARAILEAFGQPERAAFATGGSGVVGGWGGVDSQIVSMRATPGELVNVSHGDSMASVADEISSLRADLRSAMVPLAQGSLFVAKTLKAWDGRGVPPEREDAA